MGRIIAIDYGRRRAGIAVTDELQLIANALDTVRSEDIMVFLKKYISKENIDAIVVGEPKQMDYSDSEAAPFINSFIRRLKEAFPNIPVERIDERFTSKIAARSLIDSGLKKKQRQNKALLDSVSATIILQTFLETRQNLKGF